MNPTLKKLKRLPETPHKTVEKILAVCLVLFAALSFVICLPQKTDVAFSKSSVVGTVFYGLFLLCFFALGWLQGQVYQTPDKKHSLDERQMQQRLRIYYISFFVLVLLAGAFLMVLNANLFGITERLYASPSGFLGSLAIWFGIAIPSVVAAWVKNA